MKKVKNLWNIKYDSEPVYGDNDKQKKEKIIIYDNNVNTNFHDKKVPKENVSCKCLSLIMLEFVKVKKKYSPQALLEECKYETKTTKMVSFVNDEFERSSSDDKSDKNESLIVHVNHVLLGFYLCQSVQMT